jgi:hypothetical protein
MREKFKITKILKFALLWPKKNFAVPALKQNLSNLN